MTSLTFHGGISTIGGNCVIVEESNTRIMLDNDMCFSGEGAYYKDFLSPRTNNDLRDYLKLGLIPEIPGIYGKEKIYDACLEDADSKSEYLFKADLISYDFAVEESKNQITDESSNVKNNGESSPFHTFTGLGLKRK
ncbi:hypothetical protein LCGC14_1213400 [marine sediment metagenome]|uniref:Uncharacterized protein n=1 Tax=marine sediment metagenome TaxID=412755 RepID=A0A0F9LHJ0_9ZZZZ